MNLNYMEMLLSKHKLICFFATYLNMNEGRYVNRHKNQKRS